MASKIKVDNITDQDNNSVISRCGSTHTVTAEVYKADTIKDTSNNTYLAKCGTAVTVGGASQTVSVPGNDIRSNNYKASDGGVIISQSGSTITIGASGDTVSLAAGATNDLGGGVQWETTPKTANFNAGAGEGYFVDTSSNTVTVTLPTGVAGESVTVLDYVSNANTNEIFFKPQSGEKIEGGTEGQVVSANRQATTLTYSGSAQGWLVSSSGDSGPIQPPTITFATAAGSLGTLDDSTRTDPNGNLSPVTATTTFGTLNYAIQSGSLPSSLTLNSSTGAFVGTADSVGSETTANFTVRATVTETGSFLDRAFSITQVSALYVTATGGNSVNTVGDFKIHTFTGPGTFTVSCAGNPFGSSTVDYMVVGGGGGGNTSGPGGKGGGGGAGGFRTSSGAASGCYSTSPLGSGVAALPVSAQGYPITVGGGGAGSGSQPSNASSGSASSFSNISSAGGGYAGGNEIQPNGTGGGPGGSGGGGGGGGGHNGGGGSGNTPPVSPPQGNPGGSSSSSPQRGGGGGGAGGSGGTVTAGSGTPSNITNSPTTYSEGGVGFPGPNATGPSNSGDGGGGTRSNQGAGSGGSGIVVIRYKFQ